MNGTTVNTGNCFAIGTLTGFRAAIFDFNGTITDDEELQYRIYAETFEEELGVRFSRDEYFCDLFGRSDPEIIGSVLARWGIGWSRELEAHISSSRIARYLRNSCSAPPVRPGVAALIRALARQVSVGLVTGAPREEAAPILDSANLNHLFTTIVTMDDVSSGKPDPEGYLLALQRLRQETPGLEPWQVVAFEDSLAGIAAAQAAGMKCIGAYLTSQAAASAADQVVEILDESLLAA
jgi:HAD superfamily hydrolase (TIGR01509 family)